MRWDPVGHAAAELAARAEVGFPPAVRMAAVEGSAAAVAEVLGELGSARPGWTSAGERRPLPELEVLGPVELEPAAAEAGRTDAPRCASGRCCGCRGPQGRALAAALHAAQAARTARKAPDPVRVRLDPVEIG